jgi:3-oxoacyl-[acyl-carrier protein] reductase
MSAALSEERTQEILLEVPMKRLGQPHEVASAITWLASDDASFVTGTLVPVTGAGGMGF